MAMWASVIEDTNTEGNSLLHLVSRTVNNHMSCQLPCYAIEYINKEENSLKVLPIAVFAPALECTNK